MKTIILLTALVTLNACAAGTKEFFDTVEQQRAEGYDWAKVDCRPVNPELPALTMDTPVGKNRICYKLVKQFGSVAQLDRATDF